MAEYRRLVALLRHFAADPSAPASTLVKEAVVARRLAVAQVSATSSRLSRRAASRRVEQEWTVVVEGFRDGADRADLMERVVSLDAE